MSTTKRYLISSLLTFLTGVLVVLPDLVKGLTADNVSKTALIGILMVAVRAGLKYTAENISKTK